MSNDLVERVAAVIAYGDGLSPVLDSHRRTANAAIAVLRPALRADALEEAAKVADACPDSHWGPTMAAAIRALVKEPQP